MCREIKAVLFDLDGVLIDSETQYTKIWTAIDRRYPTGEANFPHVIKGSTLPAILSKYFREEDRDAVVSMLRENECRMIYEYCPGAEELLHKLRAEDIHTAIVTSSKKDKLANVWRQLPDLRKLVDAVIDADNVIHSKPHPQGYLMGAEALGISTLNCIVIEDSLQGIIAGKRAGCRVVGLTGTFGRQAIMQSQADVVLDTLVEIDLNAPLETLFSNI